jgi:hypothetical protein
MFGKGKGVGYRIWQMVWVQPGTVPETVGCMALGFLLLIQCADATVCARFGSRGLVVCDQGLLQINLLFVGA